MHKKSFHKTLLIVDKQRVKCERTFSYPTSFTR